MSNFVKHMTPFKNDDNYRGNYSKHIFKKKSRHDLNFELNDNFISNVLKHQTDFDDNDNFRGKA